MRHRKSIVTKSTVLMLAAFLALGTFASRSAEAASPAVGIPVTGTLDDGGTFAGTLDVQRFRARDGALQAIGALTGTLTDADGNVLGSVDAVPVTLPVAATPVAALAAQTCPILHLDLGPLDLNLLGLVVHLDEVVLDLSAEAAPGNLLGNLLCAVTGLLDPQSVEATRRALVEFLGEMERCVPRGQSLEVRVVATSASDNPDSARALTSSANGTSTVFRRLPSGVR